jgi:hypothetical protein
LIDAGARKETMSMNAMKAAETLEHRAVRQSVKMAGSRESWTRSFTWPTTIRGRGR